MDRRMPRGDGQALGPRRRAFGLGAYLRAGAAVLRHLPGPLYLLALARGHRSGRCRWVREVVGQHSGGGA